jgi:hypothetical protein
MPTEPFVSAEEAASFLAIKRRYLLALARNGIDDESSHPELCSGVADGVTREQRVSLPRPDAGKSAGPVR